MNLLKRTASIALLIYFGHIGGTPLWAADNIVKEIKKLSAVLNITSKNYVEDVKSSKLVAKAIKAMLKELDPHSVYIPPKEKKKLDEEFGGKFEGIGIRFRIIEDTIAVVTPLPKGPSEKLGIQCGDRIVTINGTSAVGIANEDVPKKLKGRSGTSVNVEIKRRGVPDLISVDITRGNVPIRTVDAAYMIPGSDVGYVFVNLFGAKTHKEIVNAARDLRKQGMKRLILDLRYNGGGYMNQAFRIADEFIKKDELIVYTEARKKSLEERLVATGGQEFENMPIIVLINAGSASASEIVSGAIQDLDRGLVVGTTSFGKGLVQQQYPLEDGSAFRITIAKYYTPAGRLIQRPYKDSKKYYALEGRAELEEGRNIDHESEDDSTRPAFKTRAGRTVYGGGGIVPDYIVKNDTISEFRLKLAKKNAFGVFAEEYVMNHGNEIRNQFDMDLSAYIHSFAVDDGIVAMFKETASKNEVEWDEQGYMSDKETIDNSIKATIAYFIWNTNVSFIEAQIHQKQVEKAIELFPEAARIAHLKR